MRAFEAVDLPASLTRLDARRIDGNHLLPGLHGPRQVLLAECADESLAEQRLQMARIDGQCRIDLLERAIAVSAGHDTHYFCSVTCRDAYRAKASA